MIVMKSMILLALLTVACGLLQRPEADPLTAAVRGGDVAVVRVFLARGADPDAHSGVNDWPLLLHAVHKNQLATAEALLDGGADIDRPDPSGTTALMMAAGYGNDAMVKLLLARGADLDLTSHKGQTALDFALRGVADIDRFTLFHCQNSTAVLLAQTTALPSSRRYARLKRCG